MRFVQATALAFALFFFVGTNCLTAAESDGGSVSPNQITMNFQDVDIAVLAKFISELTGKNFIVNESVRGKVSVISPTKVTPQQAYAIFQSILQTKGFTTVQAGPVIKIVPARVVRESAVLTNSQEPGETRGDEYVTRMVKLKNVEASSIVNVIQPMISHDGLVAAYPEANTLIITDDAWNVERLLKILGALDVEGMQQDLAVIPLKLAFADDLAAKISQIMEERVAPGSTTQMQGRPGLGVSAPSASAPTHGFKIVPDERTNSLIVLAPPLQMRQIKDLVDKLDVHSPLTTARIHVYRLKNAQSAEIVGVISSLIGGGGGGGTLSPVTGRGSLGRGGQGMGMGMGSGFGGGGFGGGGYGGSSFGGGYGGYGGSSFGGGGGYGGYGGSSFGGGGGFGGSRSSGYGSSGMGGGTSVSSGGGMSGGTGVNPLTSNFESQVSVTADPATNSLVISAAPQDYEILRNIIEQLDVPRRQVFVQAVVVEVSTTHERDLGINFSSGTNFSGSTLGVGQLNFGQLQNALSSPLGMTGLSLGLTSASSCSIPAAAAASTTTTTTTTTGNVSVPCDVALLTALAADTHSNILSSPTLLTADNEEATIVVGENLPFVSSALASGALVNNIFNSVDRQNVGITLDIVPQVTEGDYVRMDLYEEVSAVVGGTENSTLGPTTTIRSASTTVMVQDHRTTVIGGLLSDNTSLSGQGVPYLSTIPVLGNLFSNTSRTADKTNLIVFLTPHVIRSRQDLRSLSLDERQKFLRNVGKKEQHDMPTSQLRELYKPNFSISVPPNAELGGPYNGPAPEGAAPPAESAPPAPSTTPLNTEEINPTTMKDGGGSPSVASGITETPLGAGVSAAPAGEAPPSSALRAAATGGAPGALRSASAATAPDGSTVAAEAETGGVARGTLDGAGSPSGTYVEPR